MNDEWLVMSDEFKTQNLALIIQNSEFAAGAKEIQR